VVGVGAQKNSAEAGISQEPFFIQRNAVEVFCQRQFVILLFRQMKAVDLPGHWLRHILRLTVSGVG
jgi:hypothetical protein